MRAFKRGQKTLRHLLGPDRHCREDGGGRWPPQQRTQQLHGGRVGPVEVVQHQDDWPCLCKVLEQRAHRTVTAIALMLERHLARSRER